jgi:hypothetical protein
MCRGLSAGAPQLGLRRDANSDRIRFCLHHVSVLYTIYPGLLRYAGVPSHAGWGGMAMQSQTLQHCILGFIVLGTLFWLDLVPFDLLGQVAMLLLAWAAFSTLLVAFFGIWVAIARGRHARRLSPQRLSTGR